MDWLDLQLFSGEGNKMLPTRPLRVSGSSIGSIESLCKALDLSREQFEEALWLEESEKYTVKLVEKLDGTLRTVHRPHRLIRRVQRRINKRIFSSESILSWPHFVYGSLPNQHDSSKTYPKDYIACARVHCGAKSLLKLDIKDFFDNINQDLVEDIFISVLKYSPEVSKALAIICCLDGRVVQGALTSSYLSCMCLYDVEGRVVERLSNKGFQYTRYVDDITISSLKENASFDFALNLVASMLDSKDLPLNAAKTRIQRLSTESLTVHGLRVSFKEPRLPSDEVRRIRAAVNNIESLASEPNYRTSHAYRHDFNRCMGRVNKLGRVGHNQHSILVKRLTKVEPLPSIQDIDRIDVVISRLEKDHSTKGSTFWYARRFYRVHERLNVLNRSFSAITKLYRARLKAIRTTYARN
jgi:RNA-directed DNA polymerase